MKLTYDSFINRSNSNLSNIISDKQGNLWFINNSWRLCAVYFYNIKTDEITAYENIVNQDGVTVVFSPSGTVQCIAEDLEGNMWVGTSAGPLMLEQSQMDSENPYFTQVKVPRNDGTNYADYLLAGANINCIAVDGGGRKARFSRY